MLFILFSSLLWANEPKKKTARRDVYKNRDHMRPSALKKGEMLYGDLCWQCHGKQGLGDGPMAKALSVSPPPLAGMSSKKHSKMIAIVQNGKAAMPAYAELIDKHDTKKILQWLSALDSKTGEPKKASK